MSDIVLREIQAQDLPGVYDVALASWQHTYADIYSPDFIERFVNRNYDPTVLGGLLPRVEAGEHFFYVAVLAREVLGYCHMAEGKEAVELLRIYLHPSAIGQGIGHRLLRLGEVFVAAKGYDRYFCFVHRDNELGKRFYLRQGFKHIPRNDEGEEWYMEKQL
ncbi:MAG: GNAT family N-acetyltransferase [Chloroflexota bacterium]|nr:GNAT family N-acetyltransferase [Chloroflexota bacterium]